MAEESPTNYKGPSGDDESSLKRKTVAGTIWSMLERFSTQGVSFVVMIVMARVLTPADYGLVGMITIFIYIAQSLVDCGFSQALIRKLDRSETDNSTTFYFNIAVGVLLYVLLWFLAPVIARFYSEPLLIPITRIICVGIVFNSLSVVQRAIFTIEMNFKIQAKATLVAALLSGGAGIAMAYTNCGVWSIVAFQFLNSGLNCLIIWIVSSWRPRWTYSWASFRNLFGFGSKLALSGFIQTLYTNAYIMVIGRVYKVADLGYYTRSTQFGNFLSGNISNVVQRVTYPVLCRYQGDPEGMREKFNTFLRVVSLVMFVLMMGLAGVAKPLILSLLGEEWLYTATLLQVLCFGYMWNWVYSINLNILLVKGRSDLFLNLEIIKKVIFVGILFATMPFGLIAICWGQVACALLEVLINSFYTGKFIGVGIWSQLRSLLPSVIVSVSMGALVYFVTEIVHWNSWLELLLGVGVGVAYLFIVMRLTGNKELAGFLQLLKSRG
ncbi:MAG: lipopolysaccharide biosynthesis protein [Muribaculaceae bacterium]|nr:lipopolysaccharide biosynthesis protein [Muribaculaceae bacterium]